MENPDVQGKMLVIIGEKLNLKNLDYEFDSASWLIDNKFLATYKINEVVCGEYTKDTISFIAYDHYGIPPFSNYKNAMLFLSQYDSVFYHMKYQFFDVYKTKDGRWASSYKIHDHGSNENVKPVPIEFTEEVSYNVAGGKKKLIREYFPEPYYKRVGDKMIALWGSYVPELFQLKKEGVLTARGLFGNKDNTFQFTDTEMAEVDESEPVIISRKERGDLKKALEELLQAIKTKNWEQAKELGLDSIYCSICEGIRDDYYDNELDALRVYFDSAIVHYPDTTIWGPVNNRYPLKISITRYNDPKTTNPLYDENGQLIVYTLYFETKDKSGKYSIPKSHIFKFVKISGKYKFYGMTSY